MGSYTILNPASERPVTTVPGTSVEETDAAIARAQAAQREWRAVAPGDRARLLRAFAAEVDAHVEDLAQLEVANSGHPVGAARWEAAQVRDVLQYYAAAPERLTGKQITGRGRPERDVRGAARRRGPHRAVEFPDADPFLGNGAGAGGWQRRRGQPAEMTPLTAIRIGELALQAGLPENVFQVLPGKGSVVGQRLVDHPAVRKIVFTGSTEVGQQIMTGCAKQVKRLTLELGGKSANIVFADSDIERAAATAPYAVFDNAGQDCCARSRILVLERSALDKFMGLLEPAVKGVKVGDPALADTEMGPLISASHRAGVARYVPDDAPVAFRGSAPDGPGYWFAPTVLAPIGSDAPAYTEEIFGPVVTVTPFNDEAEAIEIANDTPYGLSGSIWTGNIGRAIRVARAVETGNLSVNSHSSVRYWTPFGGFKQSGLGRELQPDTLDAFTEVEKNVFIATEN